MLNESASTTTTTRPGHAVHRREPNPYGGNFMLTPSLMEYLTPDLTLPEQFYMRQQADDGMGPERALMYAVLKDGIRSFYKNVGATRRKFKKVLAEAEAWISEDSWDYPFSFRVICETLGIDAECLRARLLDWRDSELRRRELTGEKATRPSGRSPFPSPIDVDGIDRLSIDTDIDLDQDADLGFSDDSDDVEDWEDRTISLEELSCQESAGMA